MLLTVITMEKVAFKKMGEKVIFNLSVSSTVANPSIKVQPVTRPETFRVTFILRIHNALSRRPTHI